MIVVGADLVGTPHDFRRGSDRAAADDSQLCVFCHTPVGVPSADDGPRWQRGVQADFTFQTYATQSDPLAEAGMIFDVAGLSVVCLSCHDAGQAATVTRSQNDHPFGVPYRGALETGGGMPGSTLARASDAGYAYAGVPTAATLGAGDFRRPRNAVIDGRVVWWASVAPEGSRRTREDLPLYTRREGSLLDDVPFVECGSCHDPHSNNPKFLRLSEQGNLLCLTCHQK